jgi:hypothetical protein
MINPEVNKNNYNRGITCVDTATIRSQLSSFEIYELENQIFVKQQLLKKHSTIQPANEQLELIENLVTDVELLFKHISDKLLSEELQKLGLSDADLLNYENPNDLRKVKGIVRVGLIEKTVLLKSDRIIELVVLCSSMPTNFLVRRICNELELSECFFGSEKKYTLINNEQILRSEASIYIKTIKFIENECYTLRLMFTCAELDNKEGRSRRMLASESEQLLCDSGDFCLPVEKCANAIVEIRRTRWFTVRLKPTLNALLLVRIMRDLCKRIPTWSVLNDHLLELIIDKCFVRHKYEDISNKFRTIFELIASGVLFLSVLNVKVSQPHSIITNNDPIFIDKIIGFLDPCDVIQNDFYVDNYKCINVFEYYMSKQQCEDLMCSAQHALRLLSFKKADHILGLPIASSCSSRLASNTSGDEQTNLDSDSHLVYFNSSGCSASMGVCICDNTLGRTSTYINQNDLNCDYYYYDDIQDDSEDFSDDLFKFNESYFNFLNFNF